MCPMRSAWIVAFLLPVSAVCGVEDKKPNTLKLDLKKGDAAEFVVQRSSTTESQTSQGEFKRTTESELVYRIEAAERKDNGDLSLKITLASIKAKGDGRDGATWEIDSGKTSDDETGAVIHKVMGSALTVAVKDGKLGEVEGLVDLPRPEGGAGGGNSGLFRVRSLVGRDALRGDLQLILSAAVQGSAVEVGKEYQPPKEAPASADDGAGQGRRRFFGRDERLRLAYKLEGDEREGDQPAWKFALNPLPPEPRTDGNPAPSSKVSGGGKALVHARTGLLLKLNAETESVSEGERNGQTFKFVRKSKVSATARTAEKKKAAEL